MKTKVWFILAIVSASAVAQTASSVGEQAANPNMIRICNCLEQGKDANCQPLRADEQASAPRMPAGSDHNGTSR